MNSAGDQFAPAAGGESLRSGALELLVELVRDLPPRTADQIVAHLSLATSAMAANEEGVDGPGRRDSTWVERFVPASQRDRARKLEASWSAKATTDDDAGLGVAIAAASAMDRWHRQDQQIELVWTGPPLPGQALRRTDQVLLDLIDGAHERLVIVSFAAYQVPALNDALLRAVERGVHVAIVLESETESHGKVRGEPVRALGPHLTGKIEVWGWPLEKRPRDARGRHGALHAKFAFADDRELLVSSANLTPDALGLNLELGVRIIGGPLPQVLGGHVRRLMRDGDWLRA